MKGLRRYSENSVKCHFWGSLYFGTVVGNQGINVPGAVCRVISRGIEAPAIFLTENDRRVLPDLVDGYVLTVDYQVNARAPAENGYIHVPP